MTRPKRLTQAQRDRLQTVVERGPLGLNISLTRVAGWRPLVDAGLVTFTQIGDGAWRVRATAAGKKHPDAKGGLTPTQP